MRSDYENDRFLLVSGCAVIDKNTDRCLGTVVNGGVEWPRPDYQTQLAVSAFIGECAMNGISFSAAPPHGGESEKQEEQK